MKKKSNIRVKVNKYEIKVYSRKFIPSKKKTIRGEDGNKYNVLVKGTGREVLTEIDTFKRPQNGENLPESVFDKYPEEDRENIRSKVLFKTQEEVKAALTKVIEIKDFLLPLMITLDGEEPLTAKFMTSVDELRSNGKKARWSKKGNMEETRVE